ncbi:MAG: hypothetical protein OEZ43_08840 [Gammaproteobacteria bacterium]|nr:hypothetical protein [Gammaproteobacteria bacterium]
MITQGHRPVVSQGVFTPIRKRVKWSTFTNNLVTLSRFIKLSALTDNQV